MNRSKKLYVLLGVLLAACILTFAVSRYEEHKEKIKNSDEIILELASEDVKTLSWKNGSETLAFHKDGVWLYDEDEAFPVDEEKINELLGQFQEFGVSFKIEEVEDFGQYGLDSPICTINIGTETENYQILLGDYSAMDSERYVAIGDGNAYLVKDDPLEYFDATLKDLIDHDEIPVFDEVKEIEFSGSEAYQIVYEEESSNTYCKDDVYFAEQDGSLLPLDTSKVNSYLQTISYLDPTDYVSYNVTDEELESYGLDQPELTVTVQYSSQEDGAGEDGGQETEDTFVLHVGRDPEEREAAEKKEEEGKTEGTEAEDESGEAASEEEITAYVRVGESKIVYQVTSEDYKELMDASYNSLRHQEVLSASFEDIYQIDVSLEGVDYAITSEEKDGTRTYYYQEEALDMDEFQDALEALSADSFTDSQPTEKEEISLTVHLDNENFPEVHIALYRYDGTYCLAVVDGDPVSFVERAYVVDLIEAVNGIVLGTVNLT